MATEIETKGKIVQVLGAVVDVEFPPDKVPDIYNEIRTRPSGSDQDLILEVEQLLGNNWVRCVAMGPTDGLQRGVDAYDMGHSISVPVGEETLGRIFNVLGQPIDNKPDIPDAPRRPIHREAPPLEDQAEDSPAWVNAPARAMTSIMKCKKQALSTAWPWYSAR